MPQYRELKDALQALDLPVSTATQNALDTKASLASPALTGTPTAPTAAPSNNSMRLANTAFVATAISAIPTGGTVDQTIVNGSVNAVSGNAVYDALVLKADAGAVNSALAAKASLDGAIFTDSIEVPNDTYNEATWNGSNEVPTKNALRDIIETIIAGTQNQFDAIYRIPDAPTFTLELVN